MSRRSFKNKTSSMERNVKHKYHVLLVDHDNNHRALARGLLECYSYKVTTVKLPSTALALLSRGKCKFDLLIESINSPDSCGFKLLCDAANRNLPALLLLDENDINLTIMGIENGAFLCIKRPLTVEITKYLWQHVFREKLHGLNENEEFTDSLQIRVKEECNDKGYEMKIDNGEKNSSLFVKPTKKMWTEWTPELHEIFMNAIEKLGEGRCYPKEILELMNVPGLTRMQVASHLQKCRSGTWKPHNEAQSKVDNRKEKNQMTKPRRFGLMPHLGNTSNFDLNIEENENDNIYSAIGNNFVGENILESSKGTQIQIPFDSNGENLFENMDTLSVGQSEFNTLGVDDEFISDGQFVFDAQYVTPNTYTSLEQINTSYDNFEVPDLDQIVPSFLVPKQEPGLDYNEGKTDPVYDNQVPAVDDIVKDQWSEMSKFDEEDA